MSTSTLGVASQLARRRSWDRIAAGSVTVAATVAGIGVVLVLLDLALGNYLAFGSGDGAIKFLAISAIAHHWSAAPNVAAAIPYHLAHIDPSGRYAPPLTARYNGHLYAGYSLAFEYLTAIFYTVFGGAGLVFPSILATLGLLCVQLRLASWLGVRTRVGLILTTVAGTPLVFYALNLWEHSLGVAFVIGGIAVLFISIGSERASWQAPIVAGLLFFAAVMMRRELLIVALAALAVSGVFNPRLSHWLRLAGVAATLALPIWLILHFHPQPLALGLTHASPGRAPEGVSSKSISPWQHLQWLAYGGYATVLFGLASLAVAISALRWKRALIPLITLGSLGVGFAYAVHLFQHFSLANDNPLAFCPLAIWAVWSPALLLCSPGPARRHLVVYSTIVVGTFAVIFAAYAYGGGQWGPRYLLFAFPLLVLLAFGTRDRLRSLASTRFESRLILYSFVVLLGLSVGLQAVGILALGVEKQRVAASALDLMRRPQKVIVLSSDSSLDVLYVLEGKHAVVAVPAAGDQPALFASLRHAGVRSAAYVCPLHGPCAWPRLHRWSRGRTIRASTIHFSVYRDR